MQVYMHFFLYAGTGVFGRGGNLIQVTEKNNEIYCAK